MTRGPVAKQLLQHSGSMLVGIASIILLNVTDTFFIGQLGPIELAAISFTFPVTMLIIALTLGLSVGTSAIVSRAVGKGDHQETRKLTTNCLVFALLLVIATTVLGFLTIDPVFKLLGASEHQLAYIREYMEIWYLGIGLVVIPMVGNSAIRANGDTRTPSRIMLLAAFTNMILDPLLIFGIGPFPRLELQGAALATVIAYSLTFMVAVWVLTQRLKLISFAAPSIRELKSHWGQLLRLGLPAAATNILNPITAAILTYLLSTQSLHAVAAYGVGTRVESLAMIGVMAMSSILTPYIGQNLGAGKPERVLIALKFCQRFALVWGLSVTALLFLLARPIAQLFSNDPDTIHLTSLYLMIAPMGYFSLAWVVFCASMFNAFHQPFSAARIVLLRLIVLTIPLASVGLWFGGVEGVFIGIAAASIIAGIRALSLLQKKISELEEATSSR